MSSVDSRPVSPCVKICVVDPLNGQCVGCGRSVEEIAMWRDLDETRRAAIMAQLPERLAAARRRSPRAAKVGRAENRWL